MMLYSPQRTNQQHQHLQIQNRPQTQARSGKIDPLAAHSLVWEMRDLWFGTLLTEVNAAATGSESRLATCVSRTKRTTPQES